MGVGVGVGVAPPFCGVGSVLIAFPEPDATASFLAAAVT